MLGRSGLDISNDRRPDKIACKARTMVERGLFTGDILDEVSIAKVGRHSSAEKDIQIGGKMQLVELSGSRRDDRPPLLLSWLALTLC